ncbi:Sir2 family NAD-dependent protein deacetylase [Eikenella corrodens]|nr:Sir2 family NAD-dependent protein deacetylase [Eikenella corrodens]MDN8581897.1 Sir2 family NAD-dependent protein deacetylase [Eikenella corrodens]
MQKIVVLTGAGISADSGLRTFRDTDGLWEGYKVEEVCTPEAFARNPQLVIDFYNERRRQAQAAEPNAAHRALAELEKYYQAQIVTQNVDDLHERAGSSTVLHLHGELNKARSSADENYVVEWTGDQSINDTDPQGYPMRPHIVWFGEAVPLIETAARWVSQADKVLVVGTSMQVYPAAGLLEYAPYEAERYLVDPRPPKGLANISIIEAKAKDGVPQLVEKLIAEAAWR